MDIKVAKKLGLKERYTLMTRDLAWDTTYQPMEKIFPQTTYEGIKIHDWNRWEDPFRLTMDAYWKYQAEKERKLYAILEAFNQNNGHLTVTDGRYINVLKLFLGSTPPLELMAARGFTNMGRQMVGAGPRVACLMQAVDEYRHFQTQIHSISNYNRFYNGMDEFAHQQSRMWYLSDGKSFFDDAVTAGPFEFMVAIGFAFEYVLTNILFVPFISGAAYNGDMAAMTVGFSAQSDEARHMTLGLECIKFMLEQDPDNLPIVQRWIDKWTWRGTRKLGAVGMMMDYMLPKRIMSFKEAWEMYFEQNGAALFNDLARYGVKIPKCFAQTVAEKEHVTHQSWIGFYMKPEATPFHTWMPEKEELDWLCGEISQHLRQILPSDPGILGQDGKGRQALQQQDRADELPGLRQHHQVQRPRRPHEDVLPLDPVQRREVPFLLGFLPGDFRERAGKIRPGLYLLASGAAGQLRA